MPRKLTKTESQVLRMTPEQRKRVKAYKDAHRFETEAEALRDLIERGLEKGDDKSPKS